MDTGGIHLETAKGSGCLERDGAHRVWMFPGKMNQLLNLVSI